jgi:hypothetical protein
VLESPKTSQKEKDVGKKTIDVLNPKRENKRNKSPQKGQHEKDKKMHIKRRKKKKNFEAFLSGGLFESK